MAFPAREGDRVCAFGRKSVGRWRRGRGISSGGAGGIGGVAHRHPTSPRRISSFSGRGSSKTASAFFRLAGTGSLSKPLSFWDLGDVGHPVLLFCCHQGQ